MKRGSISGPVLVGATIAGALAVWVTGAFAAGVKTGKSTASIVSTPTRALGTATAKCPHGGKAVSGGFLGPTDPSYDTPDVDNISSFRSGKGTWSATGWNENQSGPPSTFTTFVYCLSGIHVKAASSVSVPITGYRIDTATAECPKGTRAVSGGAIAGPAGQLAAVTSQKVGNRRWLVAARNVSPSRPGTLTALVYCIAGVTIKARPTTAPTPAGNIGNSVAVATAKCNKHETLLSGGFATPNESLNYTGPDIYYTTSYKSGSRSWTVAGDNYGLAGTVVAIAYCQKT